MREANIETLQKLGEISWKRTAPHSVFRKYSITQNFTDTAFSFSWNPGILSRPGRLTTYGRLTATFHPRNALLEAQGYPQPKAMKTGTTIVGLIFKALPSLIIIILLSLRPCMILRMSVGWRCVGCGHTCNRRPYCRGQELREDSLHRRQHLLLRYVAALPSTL